MVFGKNVKVIDNESGLLSSASTSDTDLLSTEKEIEELGAIISGNKEKKSSDEPPVSPGSNSSSFFNQNLPKRSV
ncbi:MAG: hypothetical protein ACK4PR_05510, partial [Gammaproteobacteria bacterium]